MHILRDVFLFFHFLGLASLFGGLFVQVKAPHRVVNNAMLHGIVTQLVTGVVLVGILEGMKSADLDNAWVAVKLAVALVIAVPVIANRHKPELPNGLYFGMLALTVLNIAVATFWH